MNLPLRNVAVVAHVDHGKTTLVDRLLVTAGAVASLPEDQAPQMLGANLIVSNVRGIPRPMYIAGARMENMYPMSILTAGMGVNFTCVSYRDTMDFGIIVKRRPTTPFLYHFRNI